MQVSMPQPVPVLIVGAGPHALSLVLTMIEDDNSSEFTEPDTVKMTFWRTKLHSRQHKKQDIRKSIRVVDPSGSWCSTWNKNFHTYGISNLRSPLSVHLDPLRSQGLRDYANSTNQLESQVTDPPATIRFNQRSRHFTTNTSLFNESDRQFLGCPSQKLFKEFNNHLIKQYNLESMVEKASVQRIDHKPCRLFHVRLSDGQVIIAKHVVVSIGAQNIPRIPQWATRTRDAMEHKIYHSSEIIHQGSYPAQAQNKTFLVVGGGLTSVHLSRQLLSWGAKHVTLITRKPNMTVQPYDVSSEWLSPILRQKKLADFFSIESPEMKLEHIRAARGGGSVTQPALDSLYAITTSSNFSYFGGMSVRRVDGVNPMVVTLEGSEAKVMKFDSILLATGSEIDVNKESLFDGIRQYGSTVGGLPVIDHDLRWSKDINLYVMGAYAALELGPTAGNLMGARAGANKLGESLKEQIISKKQSTRHERLRALCGKENLYDYLVRSD